MPLFQSPHKSALVASLLAGSLLPLAAGCERIAFFSTGGSAPTAAPTTTGVTTATSGGAPTATRTVLLDAVASCSAELFESFRVAAEEFEAAAAAAKADPNALGSARAAWTKAIDVWQRAELFQFGPAGPSTTPGGEALRDHIYSWPLVSRCLVEQTIVSKAYENTDFGATALINTRGLAAAEYLLFYAGTDNACSPSTDINATGQWALLSATDLAARKAHYASAVATDIAGRARHLAKAWSPDGGDFKAKLANAGNAGSAYASDQMAFNAISDGMFYVEIVVKDLKLGRPLGILDCESTTCPNALESRFAGHSKPHIRHNLLGFRMLMAGCSEGQGTGFDDLLASVGQQALADRLTTDVDGAIAAVDAIKAPDLAQALEEDYAAVEKLHAAVKKITDVLKTDFVSVLDLELPQQVEGDND